MTPHLAVGALVEFVSQPGTYGVLEELQLHPLKAGWSLDTTGWRISTTTLYR